MTRKFIIDLNEIFLEVFFIQEENFPEFLWPVIQY